MSKHAENCKHIMLGAIWHLVVEKLDTPLENIVTMDTSRHWKAL
jgi:hypothetical protein